MPSKELSFDAISYTGVQDSNDPTASGKRKAQELLNCYPETPEVGQGVVGRPGIVCTKRVGPTFTMQWVGQHTQKDGTSMTLCVAEGDLYKYTWASDTWAKVGTGGSFPATGRVYAVSFFDDLIFQPNDGSTKPFAYDGGTTFTEISAAPICYGRPWVYYGKLFFIPDTTRTDIVWSDEADYTTGYTGSQAWSVYQTSTDPLTAGFGTNEYMVLWRERSITTIFGAATSTFSSDGTLEGVSSEIGTLSPDSIVAGPGGDIWFVDRNNRPWVIRPGRQLEPTWKESLALTETMQRGTLQSEVGAAYWEPGDLIVFIMANSGSSAPAFFLTWRESTGEYAGFWHNNQGLTGPPATPANAFYATCIGTIVDTNGEPFLAFGDPGGYIYYFENPDGAVWTDQLAGNTNPQAIKHGITGGALGYDTISGKEFDEVHLTFGTAMSGATFALEVPTGTGTAQTLPTTTARDEYKVHVGLGDYGRWARPIITHATSGEQFRFLALTLLAFLDDEEWS
jgi:hypothetical protein